MLFSWFPQIRNCSPPTALGNKAVALPARQDGELGPSPPLPPAVPPGCAGCPVRGDAPAPSGRGWEKERGSAVTPGRGSARGDSDSPWETARWQSWETSLALALPSSPSSVGKSRGAQGRCPACGSTHSRTGTFLPAPNRADALVAPGQRLSLGSVPHSGTPSSPQPHSPSSSCSKTSCNLHFKKAFPFQRETKVQLGGRKTPGGSEGCKWNSI